MNTKCCTGEELCFYFYGLEGHTRLHLVCVLKVLTLLPPCPGLGYDPPPFKEKDINSSPKFTARLVDRSVVAGYATAISCAVRGHPKVLIYLQWTSLWNYVFINKLGDNFSWSSGVGPHLICLLSCPGPPFVLIFGNLRMSNSLSVLFLQQI